MIAKHSQLDSIEAGHKTACPLCGSSHAHAVYGSLVKCDNCNLVRTDAVGHASARETEYEKSYFVERNAYLAREAEFDEICEALVHQIEPFVKSGSTLLDVGCGPGFFLRAASRHGFRAAGCDVSQWACNYASSLGLDVRTGLLEELAYPTESFDVIVCNHTLEHVDAPLQFVTEMKRLLKVGGVLIIGVPNFGSLISSVMRERWGGLLVDQHLWHFTPLTLTALIKECGLSPIALQLVSPVHQHPNRIRRFVLGLIKKFGTLLHRDEYMTLIARKPLDESGSPKRA